MESFADILDARRANRRRVPLCALLRDLAALLGDRLAADVLITSWTVDAAVPDNGVDIRLGHSKVLGSAAAGVLQFFHLHGRAASAFAFLLAFDANGRRISGHAGEVFVLHLTGDGWVVDGWEPDAHYEWATYNDDQRWHGAERPAPAVPLNEHAETVARLRPQVERLRSGLDAGERPSAIARELRQQGLGVIELMVVAREATGVSIGDLKAFGQWWGPEGVTDADAFDAWAAKVLR